MGVLPHRFLVMLLILALLLLVGTLGYHAIEGWPLFDSLYMTVITLTTVGYEEVHPLSNSGRVFTMLLLLGGVFLFFYAASEIIRTVVSGEVHGVLERRRMNWNLGQLHDHLIVCGFGRMGHLVCAEFAAQGKPFVVIDRSAELLQDFDLPHGIPLLGDATSDEVLRRAGVERAHALVTVAASDADNLYITLSARLLNDKLFIVARAEEERSQQKMLRAGANRVVSPYVIGGARVAQAVLRPTVVDFLELAVRSDYLELQIEEIHLEAASRLVGPTLLESPVRRDFDCIVVAIKKRSGQMIFNPPSSIVLEAGDILITLGHREQLDHLRRLARGR